MSETVEPSSNARTSERQDSAVVPGYTLANEWEHARARLALLERVCDPGSIRHLEALGVGEGWHCLDALQHSNLEVRRHNILADPLEENAFDLVHTRAVLMHLPEPERVLERLVAALKPGGWLFVEESDYVSLVLDPRSPSAGLYAKGWAAAFKVFSAAGADMFYARRLYGDVRASGLTQVDAEGHVPVMYAGSLTERFWQLTMTQLSDRMVSSGSLTADEMERFLSLYDDPQFSSLNGVTMAVWGQKPTTEAGSATSTQRQRDSG